MVVTISYSADSNGNSDDSNGSSADSNDNSDGSYYKL